MSFDSPDAVGSSSHRAVGAAELAEALLETRRRTLGLMQAWVEALPMLHVPQRPELNLPLWEWGHVAWFQSWWIGRNRQRHLGVQADPEHDRGPSRIPGADRLYDSARVPHERRWALDLPGLEVVRAELQDTLDETLHLLQQDAAAGQDLYFWHLVRAHEDMHAEAAVYMAQSLGLAMPAQWACRPGHGDLQDQRPAHDIAPPPAGPEVLSVKGQTLLLGHNGPGFSFDNERGAHEVAVPAFEIDAHPVTWAAYLDFIDHTGHPAPPDVRRSHAGWERRHFDRWVAVPLQDPASHLSAHDAQAWCRWAGRTLPTEVQWECAARDPALKGRFQWGQVWEWTASTFEPYPGFVAHPYREYSLPWFGTHRVLRGASRHTSAAMVSPTYRNFFLPSRCDVPAGFRTVSPQALMA